MNIEFFNNSNKTVLVSIASKSFTKIEPHNRIFMSCEETKFISVKVCEPSHIEKGKYVLSIETKYCFDNLNENVIFTITREKIRVGADVYFERLFIIPDKDICFIEEFSVPDAEEMKKLFKKKRRKQILLIRPLEYFTGLVLISLVLFFFALKRIGLIYTILCYMCVYIFMVCLSCIVEWFWNAVFKKVFKAKSEKDKFYNYFDNSFIFNYYSNSNREPFIGEVEN